MSKVKKTKEDTSRRFDYIITNYRKARQNIDQSKLKLSDTSRELDEVINKYNMLNKFYGQVSAMPAGSFSQFQKANLESLLVSGADNATMALRKGEGNREDHSTFFCSSCFGRHTCSWHC